MDRIKELISKMTLEEKKNGSCSVSRNIKIINKEICKRKRLP